MSQHVPEDLLQAFVEGEVGDQLAVHIAEHLDVCPACSTRAATLEPLAPAFAAVPDPVPPPDLARSVLARVARPEPQRGRVELSVAAALLLTAVFVAVALGDPLGMVVRFGVLSEVVGSLGARLSAAVWSSTLALFLSTVAALSASLAVWSVAVPPRRLS